MGDRALREYFLQVNRHISNEDGASLAQDFSLDTQSQAAGAQLLRFLQQVSFYMQNAVILVKGKQRF